MDAREALAIGKKEGPSDITRRAACQPYKETRLMHPPVMYSKSMNGIFNEKHYKAMENAKSTDEICYVDTMYHALVYAQEVDKHPTVETLEAVKDTEYEEEYRDWCKAKFGVTPEEYLLGESVINSIIKLGE